MVKHTGEDYTLTTLGVQYSTRVNFEDFNLRIQPKIVTLIVCKNDKGEYLTYQRTKQPFLGMIGFPYGKIHLGEHVDDAALRELKEKTGISAMLAQKGIMYLLVTDEEGEVVTHMLCHVFSGTHPVGEFDSPALIGNVFWMNEEQIMQSAYMPGAKEVLAIAKSKSKSLIFEEHEFVHE
jgi:ADP-ribose pyrophosphatase YjhB (NUDIX family)